MAARPDGATRTGLNVRDGSSRGRRGKPTLMASLRALHTRSGRGATRLRLKIWRRIAPKLRANGNRRPPGTMVVEAGFIVLVVLTIWMITSVSAWWVPGYVALLITIFAVPRRRRLLSTSSETDVVGGVVDFGDLEPRLRVDCADG